MLTKEQKARVEAAQAAIARFLEARDRLRNRKQA